MGKPFIHELFNNGMLLCGYYETDGLRYDFHTEICTLYELTVQAEQHLLVGVGCYFPCPPIYEMAAGDRVIQMGSICIPAYQSYKTYNGDSLAITNLYEAVVIDSPWRTVELSSQMVIVTQGTEQHALSGINGFSIYRNAYTVEPAGKESPGYSPSVWVPESLAAQLVSRPCHLGIESKITYVYGVVSIVDPDYINVVGCSVDQALQVPEILAFVVFYKIIAAAIRKDGQMLSAGANHACGNLVYGAVASAGHKAGLGVLMRVTVIPYKPDGTAMICSTVYLVVNLSSQFTYGTLNLWKVSFFTGFVIDNKTIVHDRYSN